MCDPSATIVEDPLAQDLELKLIIQMIIWGHRDHDDCSENNLSGVGVVPSGYEGSPIVLS